MIINIGTVFISILERRRFVKVLFLSPHLDMIKYITYIGDEVTQTMEPLTEQILYDKDFIISFGYRHIIKKYVLDRFYKRAVNLHISYLPWNRGADPNFWSFFENTPKGVTLHYLDEGIDTGDIIAQSYIDYDIETDTLATTYERLIETGKTLFYNQWPLVRIGIVNAIPQDLTDGSFHKVKDKEPYMHLLTDGWYTPVKIIESQIVV